MKIDKRTSAGKRISAASQNSFGFAEVVKRCGNIRIGNRSSRYFELDGMIYVICDNGEIELFSTTTAGRISQIAQHKDTVYPLQCDRGLFIINGLGIDNGYGDGEFDLILREFDGFTVEYCQSEIIHGGQRLYPEGGLVKINKYDCDNLSFYEFNNIYMIIVSCSKVYLIRTAKNRDLKK